MNRDQRQLRFGLIGVGRIARRSLAPALETAVNASLFAAASRDRERAASLRPERAYGSYPELLADPDVEAVYIATHNGLHRELAVAALGHGKHVLCEKPLACSAQEAEEMVETARSAGLHLMEAFMYRFHPQIDLVRRLVTEGRIGEIRYLTATFRTPMRDSSDVRYRRAFGGGALLDLGCYGVNLARLFLGDEPRALCAFGTRAPGDGVDMGLQAVLDYGDGRLAAIGCGFDSAFHQAATLVGERGVVELSDPFVTWQRQPRVTLRTLEGERVWPQEPIDPFRLEIEDFATAILTGSEPALRPDEGLRNARILDRLANQI